MEPIRLIDLINGRYTPIQSGILSYLNPADIASLARTSPEIAKIQNVLIAADFNINKALLQFFDNPLEFRGHQAKWNALLAGDFVAVFLARRLLKGKCMTINVVSKFRGDVERYLRDAGYTRTVPHDPEDDSEDDSHDDPQSNLKCVRYEKGPHAVIEVWWTDDPPIMDVLQRASHTALLNVISWNKAYSLLPVTTFVEQDTYLLKWMKDESLSEPLRVIAESGWTTKSIHWKQEDSGGDYQGLTRPRQIKDKYTWMFNLNIEGMTPSEVPDSVLESTTFRLLVATEDRRGTHYHMSVACIFRHPSLEYEYVTRDTHKAAPSYKNAIEDLGKRLEELTLIQIIKIPQNERSRAQEHVLQEEGRGAHALRDTFDPPATWQFHDAELVEFLQDLAVRDDHRHKDRYKRREVLGLKRLQDYGPDEETIWY